MLDVILETIKAKVSEHKVLAASFGTVFAMLLAFFVWSQVTQPKVEAESSLPVISSQLASSSSEQVKNKTASSQSQTTSGKIVADIKGAVTNEGVYELPAGSRVTDLVKMAGGFTEEADRKSVNLAEKVSDEAVVYVAKIGEEVSPATKFPSTASGSQTEAATGTINLNTATATELQTISGIGAKRAQDIIDYREANGGFTSVEELKNVSGIGDKTLEKLKSEVSID